MPRQDRLFDILRILRDGQRHRAQDIAARLGVSERTIWRDMDRLRAGGVGVEGARGAGYAITAPVNLPPLNLTMAEMEALQLGIAIVSETTDPDLKTAIESLAAKIDAVLPEEAMDTADAWTFAPQPFADAARGFAHMPTLRAAIRARQKLRLVYHSKDQRLTTRVVRPLQIEFWGRVWTLAAWCELRGDFRVFRVDLIQSTQALPELFVDEPGKTLADFRGRET